MNKQIKLVLSNEEELTVTNVKNNIANIIKSQFINDTIKTLTISNDSGCLLIPKNKIIFMFIDNEDKPLEYDDDISNIVKAVTNYAS